MARSKKPGNPIVTIGIKNTVFICSRQLIAKYSRHLKEVVFAEEQPDSMWLDTTTAEDFNEFFNWAKKGGNYRYLDPLNIAHLINFAVAFECDELREQCRTYVNLNCGNYVYEILESVRFPGLQGRVSNYVYQSFDLLQYSEDMMRLDENALMNLFLSDDLITDSEQNVVDTGIRWLTYDPVETIEENNSDDDSFSLSTISDVSGYFEEMSDREVNPEDEFEASVNKESDAVGGDSPSNPGLQNGDSGLQVSDGSTEAGSPNAFGSPGPRLQGNQENDETRNQVVPTSSPAIPDGQGVTSDAQTDLKKDDSNNFMGRLDSTDSFPGANSAYGHDSHHNYAKRHQGVDLRTSGGSESDKVMWGSNGRRRKMFSANIDGEFAYWSESSEDDLNFEDKTTKKEEKGAEGTAQNKAVSKNDQNQSQNKYELYPVRSKDLNVSAQVVIESRRKCVSKVIASTKLCHCTQDYLTSLSALAIIRAYPEAWALVQEAIHYVTLKDRRHDYVPVTALAKKHSRLQNITVSVHKKSPLTILLTDYNKKESYQVQSPFATKNREFRLVCYNDVVYVTCASQSRRLWKYDSRLDHWSECPGMRVVRQKHALVCHSGYIYAIGGDAALTVERFQLEQEGNGVAEPPAQWEIVGVLKQTLQRVVTATVREDYVIVFGQVVGNFQSTCVQYFRPEHRTVVLRQNLLASAKGLISFRKKEEVYVLDRYGALWRLRLNGEMEPGFKFVCRLWRDKIHLKGAFFVGEILHVFVGAKSLLAVPVVYLKQKVEGFCEGIFVSVHTSGGHTPIMMERKLLEEKKEAWKKENVLVP